MGKAVLISIRPKWCELIANGKKTVEIRKTRPKLETPFRCYIYQTLPKRGDWNDRDGRVIGEFVCDRIFPIELTEEGYDFESEKMTAMRYEEMSSYLNFKNGYGWHISKLVIYDKPKELGEFRSHDTRAYIESGFPMPTKEIKRPPQSWMYIEEL